MQCKLCGRQHPTLPHSSRLDASVITSNPPTPCTPRQVHYGEDAPAQPTGVGTMASDVQVSVWVGGCSLHRAAWRMLCLQRCNSRCDWAQPMGVGTMASDVQVGERVPVNW